jgi:hypothetical protein
MAYLQKPMQGMPWQSDVSMPPKAPPVGGGLSGIPFGPGHPLFDGRPGMGGQPPQFGVPYQPMTPTNAPQHPYSQYYNQMALRRPMRMQMLRQRGQPMQQSMMMPPQFGFGPQQAPMPKTY